MGRRPAPRGSVAAAGGGAQDRLAEASGTLLQRQAGEPLIASFTGFITSKLKVNQQKSVVGGAVVHQSMGKVKSVLETRNENNLWLSTMGLERN